MLEIILKYPRGHFCSDLLARVNSRVFRIKRPQKTNQIERSVCSRGISFGAASGHTHERATRVKKIIAIDLEPNRVFDIINTRT